MRRHWNYPAVVLCGLSVTVAAAGPRDTLTFHRDPQRTGWSPVETELTRSSVAGASFGLVWGSPQLDAWQGQPPRLYASPLYVDEVSLSDGEFKGGSFPVVFAATNHGFVYAISAFRTGDVPPGTILWRASLGEACKLEPAALDGVATGVLSTPIIDLSRKRLYLTSCEQEKRWQAHALDIGSGKSLPGWPVRLNEAAFNAPGINRNAGPRDTGASQRSSYIVQRGALNLSPDGTRLYASFGESTTGWIVAIDTERASIDSAYATVALPHRNSGGIWGAGGPAVDAGGNVFVVTGTGFSGFADQLGDWAQSVLKFAHLHREGFVLRGSYTPFNYCETAMMDIDLGSGGVTLLPDLDAATTVTPRLMVVGGKQGNVYLIDRDRLPGRLDRRQPCSTDSASDGSLLPPEDQPQFGKRGPLSVFGSYSEKDAAMDMARGRSVPAYFRDASGGNYVFVTGNTKQGEGMPGNVPPSIARLKVVTSPGQPAYLSVDQLDETLIFENPGSPVVTSNDAGDAIVWVLDENARRSAPLAGPEAPKPVLYALDALTFELLWKSRPGELHTSGKYNEPAIARGTVFVGTDRIQAFGQIDHAIDGKLVYEQRCAGCHENPGGRVPPRELISSRTHDYIVAALTDGVMRVQAEGLSAAEIEAVARYLK
jgi:outer membrane protein assembly factor BamB